MSDLTCSNCGAARGVDDVFCESCGMDFLSGSLPDANENLAQPDVPSEPSSTEVTEEKSVPEPQTAEKSTPETAGEPEAPDQNTLRVLIEIDRAQFDKVVQEGEVEFPDPVMDPQTLEFTGNQFFIGRTSESRAIHPDLDILMLTDDEAVSSRHAMVEIDKNGAYLVTDLGSTNGTTAGSIDEELLVQGKKTPIEIGSSIYLGAWTKLTILDPGDAAS